MATESNQSLNVVISGKLDASLSAAFSKTQSVISALETKVRSYTRSNDLNTRSLDRNTSAIRSSSLASSQATSLSRRLTEQREREAKAASKSTMEHSKLASVLRNLKNYANSDQYVDHKQWAGRGMLAGAAATSMAARAGAPVEQQVIQSMITDGKGISTLNPARLELSKSATMSVTGQTVSALADGLGIYTAAGVDFDQSLKRLSTSGKVATATGSTMGDIVQTELGMKNQFKIEGKNAAETTRLNKEAWTVLATAGNKGSFELKSIAKEITGLGSAAGNLGLKGIDDLAYVAAALQAQIKEAPDPSVAANNMYNIIQKMAGAPDFAENLKKKGINTQPLIKKGIANSTAGNGGPNAMELITGAIGKKYWALEESKRGAFLASIVQDAQARVGLLALLKHDKFIQEVKAESLKNKNSDLIQEQFETASQASAISWQSIQSSMEKFSQAATIAFGPTLRFAANVLEKMSGATLYMAASFPKIAAWGYPIVTILGSIAAVGFKIRILGRLLNWLGASGAGKQLMKWPSMLTILKNSFGGLWGVVGRGSTWAVTKLGNVRFVLGSIFAMAKKIGPGIGREVWQGMQIAWTRGGNLLRSLGSRAWSGLLRGGSSVIARLAPLLMRGGAMALRGLTFLVTGTVGTVLATLGAIIAAAIVGWNIGKWLAESTGLGEWLNGIADKLDGFQKRMDELSKPAMSRDKSSSMLSALEGPGGQSARKAALDKWGREIEAKKKELANRQSEFFQGKNDKSDQARLAAEIDFAEREANRIRGQMARAQSGGLAIGNTPGAIQAAQRRLSNLDMIVKSGKGTSDMTPAEAKAYADGLRSQLAKAKAESTSLSGAANSSNHTTQVQVDVTGASGADAGKHVAEEIKRVMDERDRNLARQYRGVVSTGYLGE